jgi:hypothetical protein
MTYVSQSSSSLDTALTVDRASNLQKFLYYFSFFLVFFLAAFIASMLMMGYEDRTGSLLWNSGKMNSSDKIGLIVFYVLQFPLGLLFGLFTRNYHNGLFAFLLNPLLIAWAIQKFFIKQERKNTRRVFQINYGICMALILIVVIYIITE